MFVSGAGSRQVHASHWELWKGIACTFSSMSQTALWCHIVVSPIIIVEGYRTPWSQYVHGRSHTPYQTLRPVFTLTTNRTAATVMWQRARVTWLFENFYQWAFYPSPSSSCILLWREDVGRGDVSPRCAHEAFLLLAEAEGQLGQSEVHWLHVYVWGCRLAQLSHNYRSILVYG